MNNEEKILQLLEAQQKTLEAQQAELQKINSRFDAIDKRFDSIEERLDNLEESAEITRAGVNSLLEWAEECGNVIKFPLPKVK